MSKNAANNNADDALNQIIEQAKLAHADVSREIERLVQISESAKQRATSDDVSQTVAGDLLRLSGSLDAVNQVLSGAAKLMSEHV